jgi:hypothetical protein
VKEAEKAGDEPVDITPKEFGVRTVAQEYGGGAFSVSGDTVIFSNYKDQRLYKQSIASKGILYCSFVWNSTMSFCIKLLKFGNQVENSNTSLEGGVDFNAFSFVNN